MRNLSINISEDRVKKLLLSFFIEIESNLRINFEKDERVKISLLAHN